MDFNVFSTILAAIAVVYALFKIFGSSNTGYTNRGGAQPLTGAGPKPRAKSSNVKANQRVRK